MFTLMLTSVLLLAGCTGNKSATTAPEANGTEETAATGGGTLIVGRGGDSAALDPAIVTDGESLKIAQQVFDTLLDYKEGTTEVMPSLAESWTISEDALTYTFKLREGVKFHDGTDFNADAVVFNFERWSDTKSKYKFEGDSFDYYDSMFGPEEERVIASVTATDPTTVVFKLNKPQAPFLQNLAMTCFGIASPKAIEDEKENFKSNPVGTGPFVFKEWKRSDSITLDKNPNYWQEGLPKMDQVIIRSIPDNTARYNALQNGEIDMMEDLSPDDLASLEANPALQKINRPPFNVAYLGFNTTKKPFDDPKVRVALNHAVDKQGLIDAFFAGQAEPAVNPIPPTLWGYNKSVEDYPYDLAKAKQLLADAGYPNGIEQELTFYAMPVPRPYMPDGRKVAEVIQASFEQIGVKVKIESPEWATYLEDLKNGTKDDLFIIGWTGDNGDPDNFFYPLLDKDSIGGNNYSQYDSKEFHDLVVKAQQETDQAERSKLYEQAQVIVKKDAPWVPLVHSTPLLAAKAELKGYVPSPTGSEAYTNVYIEQ
ncbi:ABC transporter substrate-binding protein [Paenibacillus sp. PK4536]|nr:MULTISPECIES: ABC transporter substrate-binding protein [Paenibacillus]TKJ93651.1 ABC transporter substrate-binding protein [Paenibacillus sp. CFBP13512]WIM41498.1 ABC transporter substrate-binding protein [Paenibacillus sp. PK4536]